MRAEIAAFILLSAVTPAFAEEAPERVELTTKDGMEIVGSFYALDGEGAHEAPAVVALHMYGNKKESWAPLAAPLLERGIALLAIDLRGHGESALQGDADLSKLVNDRDEGLFAAMHHDAKAAIEWLVERGTPRHRIGMIGASVGCSVAIDTTVRHPGDVKATVVLTPGEKYLGVPTMKHIGNWPGDGTLLGTKPLLVVSSEEERGKGADTIQEKLKHEGAELRIVPGTNIHGTRMFGQVPNVEADVAAWLERHLYAPRLDDVVEWAEKQGSAVLEVGDGLSLLFAPRSSGLYVAELQDGVSSGSRALHLRIVPGDGPAPRGLSLFATRASESKPAENVIHWHRVAPLVKVTIGVSLDGKKWLPAEGDQPIEFQVPER